VQRSTVEWSELVGELLLVVGQSPVGKKVNIKAEDIVEPVNRQRLMKTTD
jgi:hypothetical protein